MDVKVGSGAFMPTYELSAALAEAIVGVSNGAGVRTTALLTDMNRYWPPAPVTRLKYVKRYSSSPVNTVTRVCSTSPWRCAWRC